MLPSKQKPDFVSVFYFRFFFVYLSFHISGYNEYANEDMSLYKHVPFLSLVHLSSVHVIYTNLRTRVCKRENLLECVCFCKLVSEVTFILDVSLDFWRNIWKREICLDVNSLQLLHSPQLEGAVDSYKILIKILSVT